MNRTEWLGGIQDVGKAEVDARGRVSQDWVTGVRRAFTHWLQEESDVRRFAGQDGSCKVHGIGREEGDSQRKTRTSKAEGRSKKTTPKASWPDEAWNRQITNSVTNSINYHVSSTELVLVVHTLCIDCIVRITKTTTIVSLSTRDRVKNTQVSKRC